jgi:hypothetical protein
MFLIYAGSELINIAPFTVYFLWHQTISSNGLLKHLIAQQQPKPIPKLMYDLVFDTVHVPGSTINRLKACYAARWCQPPFLIGRSSMTTAYLEADRLEALSVLDALQMCLPQQLKSGVPPRVQPHIFFL